MTWEQYAIQVNRIKDEIHTISKTMPDPEDEHLEEYEWVEQSLTSALTTLNNLWLDLMEMHLITKEEEQKH